MDSNIAVLEQHGSAPGCDAATDTPNRAFNLPTIPLFTHILCLVFGDQLPEHFFAKAPASGKSFSFPNPIAGFFVRANIYALEKLSEGNFKEQEFLDGTRHAFQVRPVLTANFSMECLVIHDAKAGLLNDVPMFNVMSCGLAWCDNQ